MKSNLVIKRGDIIEIEKILKKTTITIEKEFYICPECRKEYISKVMAEDCSNTDKEIKQKERKKREEAQRAYDKKVSQLITQMPKIDEDIYAREAVLLALSYTPRIHPCLWCGHPEIDGYKCTNPNCSGEPEDLSIDTFELFCDKEFELPDDGWWIVYD